MSWTAFAGIVGQILPVVFKAVEIVAKDKGPSSSRTTSRARIAVVRQLTNPNLTN
jgi:hypothetical protein